MKPVVLVREEHDDGEDRHREVDGAVHVYGRGEEARRVCECGAGVHYVVFCAR